MDAVHVRRAIAIVGGLTLLFVGVMGFAHTRAGRPLLAAMGRFGRTLHVGSCPLGYDRKATPAQHERAAAQFSAAHRGRAPAEARPALGFVLDHTRRAEIVSSLAARAIVCASSTAADLVCAHVPSAILPAALGGSPERELWFTFGSHEQLLSVVALSRDRTPDAISRAFSEVTTWVGQQAGPATKMQGDSGVVALASGTLRQASAEFRFSNYYALARATNMGNGFLLTEEYRSLVD